MDDYRVIRLPSWFHPLPYNPPYVSPPGVLEALESLDAELVDFHYRWAPSYTKAMIRYKGKWMFTFHNTYGEGIGPVRMLSSLNDRSFAPLIRDRRVVCVTDFVRRDLLTHGFRDELLSVIPAGVDMYDGPTNGEDFVLFTGRLVATKGIKYLIRAMQDVDGRLVIMGKGPEMMRLKRLTARLGLERKVTFTGHVTSEEKMRLMSSCKIFALPSLFESLGMAVAEAMAFGKPIVASAVGGLPEVVEDGGILVPPRSPSELAGALNRLLKDDELRHDTAHRAKEHIRRFSWENIIPAVEKAYQREIGA